MGKTPSSDEKRQQNVRLDAEEESRLARVASHYGIGGPALLRMLLKREESALFGDAPLLSAGAGEFTVGGVVYVVVPLTEYVRLVGATDGGVDAVAYMRRVVGESLRAAREAAGLTQEGLASRLGKSQTLVARSESGDVRVGERYMLAVLQACGLPMDWKPPKSK